MKGVIGFLSAIVLLICFSSCQKEVDSTIPGKVQNDSINIWQVIVLDTLYPSPTDTVIKSLISYDAGKRISKDLFIQYNQGVSGTPLLIHEYSYKYSGANKLPDYIIDDFKDITDPTNNYTDTTYFTYNNGLVSKDSTGGPADYIVTDFTKLGNTRIKMLQSGPDLFGGIYIDTTYIYALWQNGNLIKEIDSLWIPSFSLWDINTTDITYDTKPNPFKNLVIPYPAPANKDLFTFGIDALFLPTTNNIAKWIDDVATTILTYQYGTNGLPKIATDTDGLKIFYYYTKL